MRGTLPQVNFAGTYRLRLTQVKSLMSVARPLVATGDASRQAIWCRARERPRDAVERVKGIEPSS
jgi:hypothetical protein